VDLALKQNAGSVPVQDLLADAGAAWSSHVSVQSCPPTARGKPIATPDVLPAGSARTGAHMPSTTVAGTPQLKEAR
jgi:hypothetical protein